MVTFEALSSIDMFAFCFEAIGPFLAEIQQIPCLTLKSQGQGHDQGQTQWSHFGAQSSINKFAFPVPGRKGPGRPKKTWEECVKQDLKVCDLSEACTQDRLSWRSSVKNSRQEPTPSNGSLPQSMAAPPARRVLGMRTRSFNKTGFD